MYAKTGLSLEIEELMLLTILPKERLIKFNSTLIKTDFIQKTN